ncbi:MAG TPA: M43 family zinc metalloprotease, partial [Cytophagales bacterium]
MSRPLTLRLPGWVRVGLLAALLPAALPAQPPGRCRFNAPQSRRVSDWASAVAPAGRIGTDEVLRVPVVVHLVAHPSAPAVTDAQVYAQLRVLNEDFRRRNADTVRTLPAFRPVAADCGIEFYLAPVDPEGNATSGITRTVTAHGPFANDDIHRGSAGGRDGWDPSRYLNVWVGNLAAGISGYGTPPGGPAYQDGVVVHYQHFGTGGTALPPYNRGRSATHEVGHWLGLRHPWGAPGGCADGDGIPDT